MPKDPNESLKEQTELARTIRASDGMEIGFLMAGKQYLIAFTYSANGRTPEKIHVAFTAIYAALTIPDH